MAWAEVRQARCVQSYNSSDGAGKGIFFRRVLPTSHSQGVTTAPSGAVPTDRGMEKDKDKGVKKEWSPQLRSEDFGLLQWEENHQVKMKLLF